MKYVGYFTSHNEQMNNGFMSVEIEIGQNLLLPIKALAIELKKRDIVFETIDVLVEKKIVPNLVLFADVPKDSKLVIKNLPFSPYGIQKKIKSIFSKKFDYLKYCKDNKIPTILRIYEPKVVWPENFIYKNYNLFDCVVSWDDSLIENKIYNVLYSQVKPKGDIVLSQTKSNSFVLMNSNKKSSIPGELYSERKKIIDFFEKNTVFSFDLYGFGWDGYKNYKGVAKNKLETLSKYKFCFCFENFKSDKSYITEKIFDCFFSGIVPIYYGCTSLSNYIPEDCYIDFSKFTNINSVIKFCDNISEEEYEKYISNIKKFINSETYYNNFDYHTNVLKIVDIIEKYIN